MATRANNKLTSWIQMISQILSPGFWDNLLSEMDGHSASSSLVEEDKTSTKKKSDTVTVSTKAEKEKKSSETPASEISEAKEVSAPLTDEEIQRKYDDEREKALFGVYSGEYRTALMNNYTPALAAQSLRRKAQEYRSQAQTWRDKEYKETDMTVDIPGEGKVNAKEANERKRDKRVAELEEKATECEASIFLLKRKTGFVEPSIIEEEEREVILDEKYLEEEPANELAELQEEETPELNQGPVITDAPIDEPQITEPSEQRQTYAVVEGSEKVVVGEDGKEHTLHQIVSLVDTDNVREGELGGWIESEDNLEQGSWIAQDNYAYGYARIRSNSIVEGSGISIFNHTSIINSRVSGDNISIKDTLVENSVVDGSDIGITSSAITYSMVNGSNINVTHSQVINHSELYGNQVNIISHSRINNSVVTTGAVVDNSNLYNVKMEAFAEAHDGEYSDMTIESLPISYDEIKSFVITPSEIENKENEKKSWIQRATSKVGTTLGAFWGRITGKQQQPLMYTDKDNIEFSELPESGLTYPEIEQTIIGHIIETEAEAEVQSVQAEEFTPLYNPEPEIEEPLYVLEDIPEMELAPSVQETMAARPSEKAAPIQSVIGEQKPVNDVSAEVKYLKMTDITKKLIDEDGKEHELHRIQALEDFDLIIFEPNRAYSYSVKAGDLGGWIESEENLLPTSQSWITGENEILGNAKVFGSSIIAGNNIRINGNTILEDASISGDNIRVSGNAKVIKSSLMGNNDISGTANLVNVKVYDGVDVTEGTYKELDLTAQSVEEEEVLSNSMKI